MPAWFFLSWTLARPTALGLALAFFSVPLWSQRTAPKPNGPSGSAQLEESGVNVDVSVRDSRGVPLDVPAVVRLYTLTMSYNITASTRDSSTAHFSNVVPGDYDVEVKAQGYRSTTEPVSLIGNASRLPVYVYLLPEGDAERSGVSPRGVVMAPQLRKEVEKGLEALRKKQFESAKRIFARAAEKAPGNPDIAYFVGVAELGLMHLDTAREDFKRAISLDPNHEMALVSIGELQLQAGKPADAIISLEKAASLSHAGWRTHFQLASAYLKLNRLSDAESEDSHAVHIAKDKHAAPIFLQGEIQYAEGKRSEAMHTWLTVLTTFPADPLAAEAKSMMARLENETPRNDPGDSAILPLPPGPALSATTVVEHPWAPPDVDSADYEVAPEVNCRVEPILDGALHRLSSELVDFEKFTATEHIEHQDINRYGWPGPIKARDFSYVVFVYPFEGDSFYLEEFRDGGNDLSSFPTSLATTGLNSLGVAILQPTYRKRFNYSCEGLTNLRGHGAWQIRFEENRNMRGTGVREWRRNGALYQIPIKGRVWIASASFAILRVETDLIGPVAELELTRDHLVVDYGPVNFSTGNVQLWLPWSADMYLEVRGRRYHHRHFLSDYMLFGVDTTHKVGKPKELSPAGVESSP
jgi:tetratricopeptide (TPR) repeat protein